MKPDTVSQTDVVCRYIAGARERTYPADVMEEARKCLVDWVGVCMGAYDAPEAAAVSAVMKLEGGSGRARYLWGGTGSALSTAMVNGTLSHCLDYDDTHIPSVIHISAPLWAALLASGTSGNVDEQLLLKAFITGFEVAARVGDNGIGIRLNNSGWHATPTLGRLGAAAGVAVLLGLDEKQIAHALGIAATQAGGLTASFGTMSKPFHVGKTASDGVLAAELAAVGFEGAPRILDKSSALITTLLQDPAATLDLASFDGWEIKRNSFKPYAACQLAHGAIDAARAAIAAVGGKPIESIKAYLNPLAIKIAGVRNAKTPTEGKFSTAFCIALGLQGFPVTTQDFTPARLADPALVDIASKVETIASDDVSRTSARLDFTMVDGRQFTQVVPHAFGSIGNPMGWPELDAKFLALAAGVIGGDARKLLDCLHRFEKPGSLELLFTLSRQADRPVRG